MDQINEGTVYVLTNSAMPGLIKVGVTSKEIGDRMDTLYNTSVPVPFECFAAFKVNNFKQVESQIHKSFSHNRVNPSREFFKIAPEKISGLLRLLDGKNVTPEFNELVNEGVSHVDIESSNNLKYNKQYLKNLVDQYNLISNNEELVINSSNDKYKCITPLGWPDSLKFITHYTNNSKVNIVLQAIDNDNQSLSLLPVFQELVGTKLSDDNLNILKIGNWDLLRTNGNKIFKKYRVGVRFDLNTPVNAAAKDTLSFIEYVHSKVTNKLKELK